MTTEKSNINAWNVAAGSVKHGEKNSGLAKMIIKYAALPRRQRVTVSINKLNAYAKDNESIIVPGKVLAIGVPDRKYSICAIEYSGSALKKLKDAGCGIVSLQDMLKKDGVRIIV